MNASRTKLPTVFALTHPKAGSQWVMAILRECAKDRIVRPKIRVAQFFEDAILPGMIYPSLYISRDHYYKIVFPNLDLNPTQIDIGKEEDQKIRNWYHFQVEKLPIRKFLVLRDLRDTLVSLYFSLKVSHKLITETHAERRRILQELSTEDGFIYVMENAMHRIIEVQQTWAANLKSEDLLAVRYEDLVADEHSWFGKIIKHCEIQVKQNQLDDIITANSFENVTGRKKGEEDVTAHHRKGKVGDWKNHFTEKITAKFKEQCGELLVATGYEAGLDW